MRTVRPATVGDRLAVAELLTRVDPRAPDVEVAEQRLGDVFFDNPWHDPALPSLVAEDEGGKVQGFLGVVARPMAFGPRVVRVAAGVRLTADPACREFVGVRLLRRFLEGPQDLSLVDGGRCATRAVWERLGGSVALPYALSWTRPLRPASLALGRLQRRLGPAATVVRPAATLVDDVLARATAMPFAVGEGSGGRDVDDAELAATLETLCARRPHARYDARSLAWLLERARQRAGGVLRRIVVPGRGSAATGAYALAVRPGDTAQVLVMAYRSIGDSGDRVLRDVFARAHESGGVAVAGRADLRLVNDLTDRRCLLHTTRTETLVHARDPALRCAVERGDAVLGRLDGDWWVPV